jgi:hypothetical protein
MGAKTFDAETEQLLNGLAEAARRVRQERYGRSVRVKPGTIDRLIALARMGRPGNLPSVMLHQYADALESERAENARLREMNSRLELETHLEPDKELRQIATLRARLEAAERVIEVAREMRELEDAEGTARHANAFDKNLKAIEAYDALVAEQEGRDGQ